MKRIYFSSLIFCLFIQMTSAQGEKKYITKEVQDHIEIDGILSEKPWDDVKWEGDFLQTTPENGRKPTYETQFKIVYDQSNLYVAIRAYDEEPDSILTPSTMRDAFAGDYVEINIDSDYDKKDAFSFTVTAAGIRGDEHIKTSINWFNDWNPNWIAKTRIDKNGWVAEMKIPLKELEVYHKKKKWAIQVNRRIARFNENSSWTSVPDEDKWVEYFGLLEGIENASISQKFSQTNKINKEFLKKDFLDLYKSLESSYPSLYRYRSRDYIYKNYRQTLKALEKEMTMVDFYKTVSSFISDIGDGHMKVGFPDYFEDTNYENIKRLPFKLKTTGGAAFVTENYSGDSIFSNAQIISINGISIQDITTEMLEFIPSDGYNLTSKYYRISNNFDFYYSLISKLDETVLIDFVPKRQQKVHSVSYPLLTNEQIEKRKPHPKTTVNNKSFDYRVESDVGILTLRTFNDPEGFKNFVDDSFEKLAGSNINKLILDFRGNGGGEETNAIHLYSYLTTKPFTYYDRYEVGVQPNEKVNPEASLISHETLNFLVDIISNEAINSNVITDLGESDEGFLNPATLQQPKTENNFKGQIVVLIDGGSFSATSEICAIMERDKRVTFVGEETGGGFDGNTSGIYDQIILPNSRLKIKIPLVKYVSAVKGVDFIFGRGVMPHYPMNGNLNVPKDNTKDNLIHFAINFFNDEQ